VTSPSSVLSRPEIAFKRGWIWPAPLAPRQGDDRALRHIEAQSAQHQDHIVIDHFDIAHAEQGSGL